MSSPTPRLAANQLTFRFESSVIEAERWREKTAGRLALTYTKRFGERGLKGKLDLRKS